MQVWQYFSLWCVYNKKFLKCISASPHPSIHLSAANNSRTVITWIFMKSDTWSGDVTAGMLHSNGPSAEIATMSRDIHDTVA
jgi:hypothetical protein